MFTSYQIIHPDGRVMFRCEDLPVALSTDRLRAMLRPILGTEAALDYVFIDGTPRTLATCSLSHLRYGDADAPRFNHMATALYRNAMLSADTTRGDPEVMPAILGVAVLFDRVV